MSGAFDYLDRALELDPYSAYSHYVKGIFAVWPQGRWEEGEQEFKRCLVLNPSDALCRIYYSHLLMILHRFEEAEQQARRALELDPLRPLVLGLYGVVMNFLGHYRETLVQAEKAMSVDPNNGFTPGPLAAACLATGDTLRWYEIWKQGLWWTTPAYLDSLDRVFRDEGYLALIRDRIRINEEVYATGGLISFSGQASRYLAVGDYNKAMDYYELARKEGDGLISYISLDYLAFPELKDHARYLALLEELKLPLPED
jgi:tetratricopeptide (TPR) repeat protein